MTIHLVTDSTSDISPADAQTLGVNVVPLVVRFGNEQFRDGVDIDPDAFYAKLEHTVVQPTTSQPSPDVFATLFRTLLTDPADHVVGLHISSKLSGTLQSAHLAAQDSTARVSISSTRRVSAAGCSCSFARHSTTSKGEPTLQRLPPTRSPGAAA